MRRAASILCAIAAVVCATAVRTRADAGARAILPGTISVATVSGLPVGLQWPAGDAARPVIGAVAADIDADGDLDIVANQGSIDLAVWLNDGSGRLSRATGTPSTGSHAFSTSPGVTDPLPGTTLSASLAAPVFDLAVQGSYGPLAGSGAPTGPPTAGPRTNDVSVRSSRAPPFDTCA